MPWSFGSSNFLVNSDTKVDMKPFSTTWALDHFSSRKLRHSAWAEYSNGLRWFDSVFITSTSVNGEHCKLPPLKAPNEVASHGPLMNPRYETPSPAPPVLHPFVTANWSRPTPLASLAYWDGISSHRLKRLRHYWMYATPSVYYGHDDRRVQNDASKTPDWTIR